MPYSILYNLIICIFKQNYLLHPTLTSWNNIFPVKILKINHNQAKFKLNCNADNYLKADGMPKLLGIFTYQLGVITYIA